jgi:hypothetical protein
MKNRISYLEAVKMPGVIIYSTIYFCIKAASYGLLFWLPTYLRNDVGLDEVIFSYIN